MLIKTIDLIKKAPNEDMQKLAIKTKYSKCNNIIETIHDINEIL